MKNCLTRILPCLLLLAGTNTSAQQVDTKHYNYGVWQTFGSPVSPTNYSEIRGRLCNYRWADLETAPGQWDWSQFDYELSIRATDSLPIICMIYTKEDAPDWLFENGVPKVIERDLNGVVTGYAPYYKDEDYKFYFKRMATKVREHIENLPSYIRTQVVAVQACFGSTGDFIGYRGTVNPEYELNNEELAALFHEFSTHFYNEYKNTNPKIRILSNPGNNGETQLQWLVQNCPGGWIKTGSLGKGYQLNDEVQKASWLYNKLNYPDDNGDYVRARCEITGQGLHSGWWNKHPYRNMFALMCYDIHWGLDWSNQANFFLLNHNYDSAFFFYNRYAGQKIPYESNYAMCALKDVIDASDVTRFPESEYGPATRTIERYNRVLAPFQKYGAILEDPENAILSEYDNIDARGVNDVGWNLFPGNYERFLHQIDANETSVGRWNVVSADTNSMYGRFARAFDVDNKKDQMYFDVNDAFLNNTSINGAYPVMIEIVYLDKGTGQWQLFYDSETAPNKSSIVVTCTNTGLWKKAVVNLLDANFSNRGPKDCDFNIKALNDENVIFSIVELSRPEKDLSGIGLYATSLTPFDTICVNSVSQAKSFTLGGTYLTTSTVTVGPVKGYQFSESVDGVYENSLTIEDINAVFSKEVFVKFSPDKEGSYNDNIPIKGDGKPLELPVVAEAVNSSPKLNADVNPTSCYGYRDGSISLSPTGGQGPFTYSWSNNIRYFKSDSEHIAELYPSIFTVEVESYAGCFLSESFEITQPDSLVTTLKYDEMLCKGGKTNLYVSAKGGVMPYQGTGTFTVDQGFVVYTVTDANGCTAKENANVPNGTLDIPFRPESITIDAKDAEIGVCGKGSFTYNTESVADATFYTWYAPAKSNIDPKGNGLSAVLNTDEDFNGGELSVVAGNACGISNLLRTVTIVTEPALPQNIKGPSIVESREEGLSYSVDKVNGLTYTWWVPPGAEIISGQGTSSIKVTWGNFDGNVKVSASNDCGTSANSMYYVTIGASAVAMQESSSVTTEQTVSPVGVYPNPVRDYVNISFKATKDGDYKVELTDLTGRSLMRKSYKIAKGDNNLTLDFKPYTNGIYMLRIIDENGKKKTIKIIKI